MNRFRHLLQIARDGFNDMAPALRRAFNDDPLDDNLSQVFGAPPRLRIVVLTLAAVGLGLVANSLTSGTGPLELVNWPAAFVCVAFALAVRRYLFQSGAAADTDFVWLVAPIIPATALLVLLSLGFSIADPGIETLDGGPAWAYIGGVAKWLADGSEVAAGIAIAFAALCYSQNWIAALWTVAWRLFALQIVLAVLLYIMLEISIMERILSAVVEALFGFRLPPWMGEFVDQLTYSAILFVLYFAIIGATWTVCRKAFPALLETGEVDIVETVRRLVDPEIEKREHKQAEKAARKAEKTQQKAEKKAAKASRKNGG
ncbi:MAG: hypothetical protein AAFY69_11665 [Pseudomonadota bacterium]